jgi:hypothetical protein
MSSVFRTFQIINNLDTRFNVTYSSKLRTSRWIRQSVMWNSCCFTSNPVFPPINHSNHCCSPARSLYWRGRASFVRSYFPPLLLLRTFNLTAVGNGGRALVFFHLNARLSHRYQLDSNFEHKGIFSQGKCVTVAKSHTFLLYSDEILVQMQYLCNWDVWNHLSI